MRNRVQILSFKSYSFIPPDGSPAAMEEKRGETCRFAKDRPHTRATVTLIVVIEVEMVVVIVIVIIVVAVVMVVMVWLLFLL